MSQLARQLFGGHHVVPVTHLAANYDRAPFSG